MTPQALNMLDSMGAVLAPPIRRGREMEPRGANRQSRSRLRRQGMTFPGVRRVRRAPAEEVRSA